MNPERTRFLGSEPMIPAVCEGAGEPGLVTVIIPTFNRGYIVHTAIDSVLAQTYRPIELIVVDDGSTDNTREVVARYGQAVRYIYQPNSGLAAGRNAGLAAARGEFIAFQDSDDVWLPWKLEAQVALMRRAPEVAVVWTDMVAVTPTGHRVREKHLYKMYDAYEHLDLDRFMPARGQLQDIWHGCPADLAQCRWREGDVFDAMFLGNLIHPPAALLRRRHVSQSGGLDVAYAWTCEDYEFFWRVCRYGRGALIEASSMLYRVDAEDQLTKPALHLYMARGNLIALQRCLKRDRKRLNLPRSQIRKHMAEAHAWVGEEELSWTTQRFRAVWHLLRSLTLHPQRRAVWLLALAVLFPGRLFHKARTFKQRFSNA